MTAPVSTEAIAATTGRPWDSWIAELTAAGGSDLDHKGLVAAALARLERVDNPGWWAQSVAVAYEQHIGRREPGQRQDGTFEATASRTLGGTLDQGIEAWRRAIADRDGIGSIRFATAPSETATTGYRRWRVRMEDETRLEAQVSLRGERAVVTLTWSGLRRIADRDARRASLKDLLADLHVARA